MLLYDLVAALGDAVSCCFGKFLRDCWQDVMARFLRTVIAAPGVRVSVKFHIICYVEPRCLKHNCDITMVTEWALESSHHDFIDICQKSYNVVDVTSKTFS